MSMRDSFLLRLYGTIMAALEPVAALVLRWRQRRGKEDPTRLAERRGFPGRARPDGRIAWVHGASVGEIVSLLPVMERLTRRGFTVLVTSGTVTSAKMITRRLPPRVLHQFMPLDVPRYVRRFLNHWEPDLVLIAESELWPNMISEVHARGIPLILVNARLSERALRRWRRFPKSARHLLQSFDLCLAQSKADAERLATLGAPRVNIAGNLKFDVPAPPADASSLATLTGLIGDRPVWVAASTHGGEEEMVAAAHRMLLPYQPDLLTIIAPRHPERGEVVAEIVRRAGLTVAQRSHGLLPDRHTDIYIADTIGELGLFYRLATVAFIGRSLVPLGGQNPIEPAKLGTAILHGPYVHNFADVYAAIDRRDGAMPISDEESLARALSLLFSDAARTRSMARAAAATVEELGGAVERTMNAIEPYILQMHLEARA
jgi:3-deoxy-D-manno-octulosonic-acid transferase